MTMSIRFIEAGVNASICLAICLLQYSRDHCTRMRINRLAAICQICNWQGNFGEYQQHIYHECDPKLSRVYPFQSLASPPHSPTLSLDPMNTQCSFCNVMIPRHEIDAHLNQCPLILRGTPCTAITIVKDEVLATARKALMTMDKEIDLLRAQLVKLEKMIQLQNTKLEHQDLQLSTIKNCNYDGSMIWKIPQFSQRKVDGENCQCTSMFSLPFYSGRYGYKMCLRLYVMGDGIGKGTHLSLFFVVMRGEFDNILQWPFTHKITFKLINQAGGKDIVNTFQPDPMNNAFRKPTSDMNTASGCPRFVSHTELETGGFIINDTIFIKCKIDIFT